MNNETKLTLAITGGGARRMAGNLQTAEMSHPPAEISHGPAGCPSGILDKKAKQVLHSLATGYKVSISDWKPDVKEV